MLFRSAPGCDLVPVSRRALPAGPRRSAPAAHWVPAGQRPALSLKPSGYYTTYFNLIRGGACMLRLKRGT